MTVYFISGLGADEQVFQKLKLPADWKIQHLAWLTLSPGETLSSYCYKLSKYIEPCDDFVLIGLSFGGIIAIELNKIVTPKVTILISSIATKNELPLLYKFIAKIKFNKLVPASVLKIPNAVMFWFFGTSASDEKRLLRQTIKNTDSHFLKWAIHEILNWKNSERPLHLVHVHGTKDHLFPIKKTKADIKIAGGGHLMVYDKAGEISPILTEVINKYQ